MVELAGFSQEPSEEITALKRRIHELEVEHTRTEEVLLAMQGILDGVVENTLAGYWNWNLTDNTEYLSPTFKRMFGYADHELESSPESWQRLIFQDDLPGVLSMFDQHVKSRGQVPYLNEVRYRHKDGSTIWVLCAGRVIEWAGDGTPLRMVGCHIDITDRKRSEQALSRESKALLSRSQELAHVGSWQLNLISNHLTLSDELYRIFGYQPQESLATREDLVNLVHPDDRTAVAEAYSRALREGSDGYQIGYRIVRQGTGEIRHVHERCVHDRDAAGTSSRCIGVVQDITDARQLHCALKVSEEKYRSLFDQSMEGIYLHDFQGGFLDVNAMACAQSGYSREDLLGLSVFDCLPQDTGALQKDGIIQAWNTWKTGQRNSYTGERQRKDGTRYPVEVSSGSVKLGDTNAILSVVKDISKRKKAEESLKENQEFTAKLDTLFRAMLESSQGMVVFALDNTYRYLAYTKNHKIAMKHLWGVDVSIGACMLDFISHEGDKEKAQDNFDRCLNGESFILEEEYGDSSLQRSYYETRYNPLISDDGEILGLTVFNTDITSRKQADNLLRLSEEKHRLLFETMSPGVIYQAADGSIISANPASEKILGLTLDQMTGKTSMDPRWRMIYEDGSSVPGSEHPAMLALRSGEPVGPAVRGVFIPERERYVWLSIHAVPLFKAGESKAFQVYATFDDFTERKEAEDHRKIQLQEKENLIQELFHRTYNNMQVIEALMDYKLAAHPDLPLQNYVDDIKGHIDSMAFAHRELYKMEHLSRIDLGEYLKELVQAVLKRNHADGSMQLAFDLDSGQILLDSALPLGTVINELVTNVCRHAFTGHLGEEPGPELRISSSVSDSSEVAVGVSDNGVDWAPPGDLGMLPSGGLDLARALVNLQLGGSISFDGTEGTAVMITYKDTRYTERIDFGQRTRNSAC